ncbi:MAG TPA: hypothetical protein VEC99_16520 [Clostridia bacterium]|nr:hypothetical protein [Clostridia bacterium]
MTAQPERPLKDWLWILSLIAVLGVAAVASTWLLFHRQGKYERRQFETFRDSVTRNPKLEFVVLWARRMLADTNTQAARFVGRENMPLESASIDKAQFPEGLDYLRQGVFGGLLEAPGAAVYRDFDHTTSFVVIGYDLGRDKRFGITIGSTNFTWPPYIGRKQGVKWVEKSRDGVYIYAVMP